MRRLEIELKGRKKSYKKKGLRGELLFAVGQRESLVASMETALLRVIRPTRQALRGQKTRYMATAIWEPKVRLVQLTIEMESPTAMFGFFSRVST